MAQVLGKNKDGVEILGYDMPDVVCKAVGDDEIEIVGSTEHPDRDGEVLRLDGWDLKQFKKNPVVLPSHMYWEPAIGKAKVRIEDNKLIFKILFPPSGVNPVADVYKGLYKGGFMNASSVGFLPLDYKWGEGPKDPKRTFLKQELLEISLVSIPANPNALVTEKGIAEAISKGAINNNDIKVMERLIKDCFEKNKENKFFFIPDVKEVDANEELEQETNRIKQIAKEAFAEYLKDHEEDLVKRVVEIVEKDIEAIMSRKDGHYIDSLINDQVPESTTEAINQLGQKLKEQFTKV